MATRTPVNPLYVIAGAGDLAVEKFRAVSDDVTTRFAALDQKTLQTELATRQAELSMRLEALAAVAQAGLTTVLGQAEETYDDLAARGQDIVTRIRSQKATEDLATQAKTTVSKAKATRTTARKTAETASRNVKATTTSARKTAKAATKAAGAAASKVGD